MFGSNNQSPLLHIHWNRTEYIRWSNKHFHNSDIFQWVRESLRAPEQAARSDTVLSHYIPCVHPCIAVTVQNKYRRPQPHRELVRNVDMEHVHHFHFGSRARFLCSSNHIGGRLPCPPLLWFIENKQRYDYCTNSCNYSNDDTMRRIGKLTCCKYNN